MLSAQNVSAGRLSFEDPRLVSPDDFEREHKRTRVAAGDVLLTIVGSIGRSTVVGPEQPPFVLQRSVAVIEAKAINPRFLSYQFTAPQAQGYFKDNARGTAQKGIYLGALGELPIRVAPAREQERIVDRIDQLFSDIEEGERALERVQKLTERYRQSVLKAAVTGELTREWREKHKGPLESGEALLQRIHTVRRETRVRQDNPTPPEMHDLASPPVGWKWASLDMVANVVGGITVDGKRSAEGCDVVPYLRVANVQRGYLDLAEVKTIVASRERIEQLRLLAGDVLFNEGGDIDKLGRGWIWEGQLPLCIHQNHVFRARLFVPGPWAKIISWFGNVLGKELFMDLGKQTTNLASLSLSKLKGFPVPLMSLEEATEIVSRVEDALSVIDKQLLELAAQRAAAMSLRQAVLKAAFTGALVPQDLAEEPASALIERIEDLRTAEQELTRVRAGRSKTKPLAQVMKEHGMQPQAQRRTRTRRGA